MNSHCSQKNFDFCPFGLIKVLQDWRLCCLEQTHCFFFIPPFLTFSYYGSAFHPAYLTTSVLKPEPNLLSGRRLYKWEEKAHCSSIIWHDIIWRPPKTDFWVNSWKYFETGTTFLAEIRLRGGWLGWKLFFRKMQRGWFWTIFISGRNQIAWLVFIFLGWKRF